MKKVVRRSIFETNSSATHSISLLSSFELDEMETDTEYDSITTTYEGLTQKIEFIIAFFKTYIDHYHDREEVMDWLKDLLEADHVYDGMFDLNNGQLVVPWTLYPPEGDSLSNGPLYELMFNKEKFDEIIEDILKDEDIIIVHLETGTI